MKKLIVLSIVLFMLQGCAQISNNTKENLGAEYGPHHPMDYVSYTAEEKYKPRPEKVNNFGFSRNYSNEVGLDEELTVYDIIDHQKTAEGLGSLLVQTADVKEAAVLITNEYALVAYTPNSEDSERTAQQVKMTTEAAVPYYYETVITDNPTMKEDIESFKPMDERDRGGHQALERLVSEMKQTTDQPVTDKQKVDSQ
ncbi:YhcN/YlaJ family sporulation lipoprotein [Alteribacillus iranensis]|uniref:Sporulation lipoprotein YhcN/YlaJ (Spore_YhcN_YlaJ) n=1 Tax=Alteribacillus iranensis TaxID=930128 RepID=A0A1I2ENI7_9BACI|nr:YhcN/YlaJ family sporulation lipoprotein [Alteribacillus iranensis]SFE94674.1 Sporulation lipoprotein YhcN/YlaJ (Spore_YhcN_YlaJ) [Alteribacillus iranensis]